MASCVSLSGTQCIIAPQDIRGHMAFGRALLVAEQTTSGNIFGTMIAIIWDSVWLVGILS